MNSKSSLRRTCRGLVGVFLAAWSLGADALGALSISSVQITPEPMVVGSPFTVRITGTDIGAGVVFVDFRPGATMIMRVALAAEGEEWVASGVIPGNLTLTNLVTVRVTAQVLGSAGGRASAVENAPLMPAQVGTTIRITGRVVLDDGNPVEGAEVSVTEPGSGRTPLSPESSFGRATSLSDTHLDDWDLSDPATYLKPRRRGSPDPGAPPGFVVQAVGGGDGSAVTDSSGEFTVSHLVDELPARVAVEVRYVPPDGPTVNNSRVVEAGTSELDVGVIVLPSVANAQLSITGDTATSPDGAVTLEGLPPEIESVFARSYDPDVDTEAFPGDFTENGAIPLNSSVFLWIEALDAAGNPVEDLQDAVTVRSRVPRTQWADLEDINFGTDRIEVPIYFYNEESNQWSQEGVGWLEDGDGTILPEDAESLIVGGTFDGDVYAVFLTTHFSWMNVDYPYIGPWTLSRLPVSRRNTDLVFKALNLAKTIALSASGRASYSKFNTPTGDLDLELADGAGPELKSASLGTAAGEFKGNEQNDRDDQLYVHEELWNQYDAAVSDAERQNVLAQVVITLLHETAHWKWDTKHDGGNWRNREPGGEAGNELERDLFGGIIGPRDPADARQQPTRDGTPVSDAERDGWLDPANWPAPGGRMAPMTRLIAAAAQAPSPLRLSLTPSAPTYPLGADIIVDVEYENISADPVRILGLTQLEGYPMSFELIREGEAERAPFRGPRVRQAVDFAADFVTLNPGERLTRTFNLTRNPATGNLHYLVTRSGNYQITGFYSGHWGVPETASDPVTISIGSGGALRGTVNDAVTVQGIMGASISVLQGGNIVASTTSEAAGAYSFGELPAGTYTMQVSAPGYLRTTRDDVEVLVNQTTVVNFSLSQLIAEGELRLVLTWGAQPRDLDSHLWLPPDQAFHVYYGNRGAALTFPYAWLDVDDTSSFGPETTTITQLLDGTYDFRVFNFSGDIPLIGSGAQVQVFDRSGLISTITIPTEGSGRWWNVLTIDGSTGAITPINTIGNDSVPY